MNNIGKKYFDMGYMDALASQDSSLHLLDPRAKVITTIIFILMVVSFDNHSLSALIPFLIFPAVLISLGGLPAVYIFKKVLLVSPLALCIGIFNPLIDREILMQVGGIGISGGWISLASILLRFGLTVSAALILVAITGFNAICESLLKLGVPKPFVVQLLFFYRYIFVLIDEAERMVRARSLRTFNSGKMKINSFISLIGQLLVRTLDRSERIYRAMCCRGFDGHIRLVRPMKIGYMEILFMFGWAILFVIFRYINVPLKLGEFITGVFR